MGVSTTLTPVGKNFLSSKVRVSWRFAWTDEAEVHEVVFIHSLGSGRKTIEEDVKQVLECHKTQKDFTHAWESRHYLFRVEIEKHSSITKVTSLSYCSSSTLPNSNAFFYTNFFPFSMVVFLFLLLLGRKLCFFHRWCSIP